MPEPGRSPRLSSTMRSRIQRMVGASGADPRTWTSGGSASWSMGAYLECSRTSPPIWSTSSPSPRVTIAEVRPANTSRASTGDSVRSLASTNPRAATRSTTSPTSRRTVTPSSMRSQQPPRRAAKNLSLSGGGKRIAQSPPAVKPPETTDSTSASRSTSEIGSSAIPRTIEHEWRTFKHSSFGNLDLPLSGPYEEIPMSSVQTPIHSGFSMASTADEVLAGIDLTGKTAIVTGGYSGIGTETTRALHAAGARVIVPARDLAKARTNLEGIDVEIESMDLADPASIDAFVEQFLARGEPLHILVNSAGVMAMPLTRNARGYEMQFATNHLGHFQLTT